MASAQVPQASPVPEIMTAVKQLTPAELREFKRQLEEWHQQNGGQTEEETALVEACLARLPAADERRLKKLIARSERGVLSPKELVDYQTLAQRAQSLDATRLAALTQLVRRWGKPARVIMETIGWKGLMDETTGNPPRPAKAGTRSRR